jgi:hypothetical protein
MSRRKSTGAATENDENTDSQPDHDDSTSKKRPFKRARVLAERDNQSLDDDDDDDVELLPEDDEDSAEMLACLKEKSLKNSDAGIVLSIEARVSCSTSVFAMSFTCSSVPCLCYVHTNHFHFHNQLSFSCND